MKATTPLLAGLAVVSAYSAAALPLEELSPHLSANAQIVWEAPASDLQGSVWIYRKTPHVFSAATISNAVVLAGFQSKGFPQPSTNPIGYWADHDESEPQPPYFEITPQNSEISYFLGDRAPDSESEYFKDAAAVERAWDCLAQLGIDRGDFVKTNVAGEGLWGVFLPRQVDGIQFFGESEGFSFQQFGKQKKLREFAINLPGLERVTNGVIANPQQIIACIKARKTPVLPPKNEEFNYLERIKTLSKTTRLTITKVTPFYYEGIYGEAPTNGESPTIVTPIAELEAVADFGNSNLTVHLYSPILSSDVDRLLNAK